MNTASMPHHIGAEGQFFIDDHLIDTLDGLTRSITA